MNYGKVTTTQLKVYYYKNTLLNFTALQIDSVLLFYKLISFDIYYYIKGYLVLIILAIFNSFV